MLHTIKLFIFRRSRWVDFLLVPIMAVLAPLMGVVARWGGHLPHTRAQLDRFGCAVLPYHYYQPLVRPADLRQPLSQVRTLPAIDFNLAGQRAFLARCVYSDELAAIAALPPGPDVFPYPNKSYPLGDAEMLYQMLRVLRPSRLLEIGCGNSTLMARHALAANRADGGSAVAQQVRHICIEPYEAPWLESLSDIEVLRTKVEDAGLALFTELVAGDVLFIDTSHVLRPQSDVEHLYLRVLPRLAAGVVVHIHDIFTPHDYPHCWVVEDRKLWNEQYLLEAFLSYNHDFEIICAMNMLWHQEPELVIPACPLLAAVGSGEPASFWLRRVG